METIEKFNGNLSGGSYHTLINLTTRLLEKIFNCTGIQITLYHPHQRGYVSEANIYAVTSLHNGSHHAIGHIEIPGLEKKTIEGRQIEILELIKENFIYQLDLIDRCESVGLKEKLMEKQSLTHLQELEDAYKDLNQAHEELSELFNQTFFLNASLTHSMKESLSMLHDAPIAVGILRNRNLIIEFSNKLILKVWGKDHSVLGKPLAEGLPELIGQPFLGILDQVYTSGERYLGREERVLLSKDGEMVNAFFNFFYEPIKDELGNTNGIIIIANEVTELLEMK